MPGRQDHRHQNEKGQIDIQHLSNFVSVEQISCVNAGFVDRSSFTHTQALCNGDGQAKNYSC